MQRSARLLHALVAALSISSLSTIAACKGDAGDGKAGDAGKAGDEKAGDAEAGGEKAGDAKAGEAGEQPAGEAGSDKPAADTAAPEGGEVAAGAEAGAGEAGEPAAGEAGEPAPDVIPGLLEQAKSLDTDDAAASKALDDAVAAGAAKLDVAKIANARGEALLTKGEGERAEPFFVWARDAHSLYAEPVYNLAKMSAYAGDLDVAKEHLQELEKRGNKKLMKKVGIEPAFAPLHDDPDVRKIYEQ